jgi:hypothetical protein
MSHNAAYEAEQILQLLIGGTITSCFTDEHQEGFGFKVANKGKTYEVWVNSDQEGNDCGALEIIEE